MSPIIHLVEVTYHDFAWHIVSHSLLGVYETETHSSKWWTVKRARSICREISKAQGEQLTLELQIKNKRGQIRQKDTYGYDPEKSKG